MQSENLAWTWCSIRSLVPRPTPFFLFRLLRFPLTIIHGLSTETEEQKKWGRPGNEARVYVWPY